MLVYRCLVSVTLCLLYAAPGIGAFSVTTKAAEVRVKENEGADLTCSYSGDYGANARVEWKFKDLKGSQTYVVFDGKPTTPYLDRVIMHTSNLRFSKMTRNDNGVYDCEVSGNGQFGETRVTVTVLVPPSVPQCRVLPTVTTGKTALLSCHDVDGSPPSKYRWYKDGMLLPAEPSKISGFQNATYKLNTDNGNLEFPRVTKADSGQYYCEAYNDAGLPQRCKEKKMEVRDLNTGGIVAGVLVALILLVLLGVGIWYAKKKGYLPKKKERKANVVYQPTSMYGNEGDDGEFKQKSSFVV
ncbi:junctional adhesion molecule A [Cynoglossus semilaevis]|uniref:Junctional adhesion molecule A n=1 Tax=Cynoglossus semilaevis TaxID=244447 RepID=A0A3P8W8G3_CYNSE|nr:junctional adhesion molecule A [Cynoglossus semilaevis]